MRRPARLTRHRQSRRASLFSGGERLNSRMEESDHDLIDQRWDQSIRPREKVTAPIGKNFNFGIFDAANDCYGDLLGRLYMPDGFECGLYIAVSDVITELDRKSTRLNSSHIP